MADKFGVPAIVDGISQKLDAAFQDVNIYADESVEQGLDTPAFFIAVLSPSRSPQLGPRYRTLNPFDVHYFPAADGSNTELLTVAERLMNELEYITVQGNPVRGTSMSFELVDGVLHFFINYNLTGSKAIPEDQTMEDVTVKTGIEE